MIFFLFFSSTRATSTLYHETPSFHCPLVYPNPLSNYQLSPRPDQLGPDQLHPQVASKGRNTAAWYEDHLISAHVVRRASLPVSLP